MNEWKSGVAATLEARREQLAQPLTPTFTHKPTLSMRRGASEAQRLKRWRDAHTGSFSSPLFLSLFSCPVHFYLWSPPTRSTSEITAATSYSMGAWVLIAIIAGSSTGCLCLCLLKNLLKKLKKKGKSKK